METIDYTDILMDIQSKIDTLTNTVSTTVYNTNERILEINKSITNSTIIIMSMLMILITFYIVLRGKDAWKDY